MSTSLHDTAFGIAKYYGFEPIDAPKVCPLDLKLSKSIRKSDFVPNNLLSPLEEKIACVRCLLESGCEQRPASQFVHAVGDLKDGRCQMHIVGTKQAIAEAILMKAVIAVLEHFGAKQLSVRVNSVGAKDALARFLREVSTQSRRFTCDLDQEGKTLLAKNPMSFISDPRYAHLKYDFPHTLNFLHEESRQHFEDVLEYLETNRIPYEIDPAVLGNPSYSNETVFEVVDGKGDVLASGSRYNTLARKVGSKKEMPAIGAVVRLASFKKVVASPIPNKSSTRVFLVQIGYEAKLKSLQVIDELRRARIPVSQALAKDRLGAQLSEAQRLGVPYVLIMGQHEAVRDMVLIRNTETRSQDTVPIIDLIPALRRHLSKK